MRTRTSKNANLKSFASELTHEVVFFLDKVEELPRS